MFLLGGVAVEEAGAFHVGAGVVASPVEVPQRAAVFHPVPAAEALNSVDNGRLANNPAKRVQRNDPRNVPRHLVVLPAIAPPASSNFRLRPPSAVKPGLTQELAGKQNAPKDKGNANKG